MADKLSHGKLLQLKKCQQIIFHIHGIHNYISRAIRHGNNQRLKEIRAVFADKERHQVLRSHDDNPLASTKAFNSTYG